MTSLPNIGYYCGLLVYVGFIKAEPSVPWNLTIYNNKQSWNEGYNICKNNNQTLLSIRDENKYSAMGKIAPIWRAEGYLNNDYWLGLFDISPPDGNYTWTDCTPKESWELWDTGEPDEKDTSMCVRVYQYSGKWRTFFCDDYYQIICENKLDSCWYDEYDGYKLSGMLESYGNSELDECVIRCDNKEDGDNECVAFSYSVTFKLCRLLIEGHVYIGNEPAIQIDTIHTTFVKRCYEYNIMPEMNVTVSKDRQPAHECTSEIVESTVSTVNGVSTLKIESSAMEIESSSMKIESTAGMDMLSSSKQAVFKDINPEINYTEKTSYSFTEDLAASSTMMLESVKNTAESSVTDSSIITTETSSSVKIVNYNTQLTSSSSTATPVAKTNVVCPCKCFTEIEGSTVEAEIIEEIKKELVINTTSLSSFKRKLSSASDNRSSAVVVGSIGIGFLGSIMLFVAILDFHHMFRALKNVLDHYKQNRISVVYQQQ
ncbi:uncharacterized protein LOC126816182 [Patella vulgata]|uniref:uncharacterized protein LOC126816182 n=1 Tax=Patella vulgata TaxID=6465 RepID=UPI002180030D|nr:uncharacterized protein LOC126816182 [Patella vulgata]